MWSRVANVALHGGMRLFLSSFTPVAGKGPHVRCVRAILFDKTPDANWKVPWHQDLTIAVEKRVDLPGYTAWTEKEGIPHVQPPVAVLENMLTARIHLDPCGSDNGALKVLPCTHLDGRLTSDAIGARRTAIEEYTCACKVGDVLFMRPLLLHASSPAATPSRRRVLHLEFAGCDLHNPLRWQEF
ncbi:phytanoyl-CoA dioxygenase [Verrucomicrobia bacterium LW23]|nr:phytanoyl-CoA dioxygenase [Verrucomicrobia bacterium LW23]